MRNIEALTISLFQSHLQTTRLYRPLLWAKVTCNLNKLVPLYHWNHCWGAAKSFSPTQLYNKHLYQLNDVISLENSPHRDKPLQWKQQVTGQDMRYTPTHGRSWRERISGWKETKTGVSILYAKQLQSLILLSLPSQCECLLKSYILLRVLKIKTCFIPLLQYSKYILWYF